MYRNPAVAMAALVGQPDAYAGELPLAYVQLKPGVTGGPALAAEPSAYLREHTPERAALPVALHFIDPMPLTAVGKIFKPALRSDAIRRVAETLLAPLAAGGASVQVSIAADALRGDVIRVALSAADAAVRAELARQVAAILGPLTVRHELV